MAVIEVNHQVLRDVASAINSYCFKQDIAMKEADRDIKMMLSSDWVGEDATEFGNKWEGVDDSDSTAAKFRKSLRNFSEALEACANEYQTAQEDSYAEADKLPKILTW